MTTGTQLCTGLCLGACLGIASLSATANVKAASNTITVADASLSAAFYSDSSCLLTIDSLAQAGKTIIDADVDDVGSRMLIHCDTENGRRLTLLARGDSLNVSQRVPLLTREEIQEGEFGMIVWLTRKGVHYADDSAPRRYVIAGSVMLRNSQAVDMPGAALHSQQQSFASVTGVLEPILKTDSQSNATEPVTQTEAISNADDQNDSESATAPAAPDTDEAGNKSKPSQ